MALLTIPGLVLYSRVKKEFSLPELAAASIVLSLVLLPFAAMLARPMGLSPVIPLVFLIAYFLYKKGGKLNFEKKQIVPILLALFFAFLVFAILSQYLIGPQVNPLHAADAVWHSANANYYRLAPQFPPEDTYSPGHSINANWLYTILLGETNLHIAFTLIAFALFLSVYLVAEKKFKSGIPAGILFMAFAGLSWLIHDESLFWQLVFRPLNFKFDPTLVFFFLPQPQAVGLLLLAFAFFLFFEKRHALLGLTTAALVGYHLQTGAVFFIALMFYYISHREKPKFLPYFIIAAIPFLLPLLAINQSHIQIRFSLDPLKTGALTILPLAVLAWKQRKTEFLSMFAAFSILLGIFVAIPLTWNGYRFFLFAALALAILASPLIKKPLPLLLAIGLCISSVALIGVFIDNTHWQASQSELPALEWAKENTPTNAIFLEKLSLFPRIPYLAHRRILYGDGFSHKYHGFTDGELLKQIQNEKDPVKLRQLLLENNVDYIFFGEREKSLPFAEALNQFEEVYEGEASVYAVAL